MRDMDAVFDSDRLEPAAFACDVHTHTIASRHAYSTIAECVEVARGRGLELIGSTDHYSPMLSPTIDVRDYQHFINFSVWPRVWDGVFVLRGAEVDICDLEGHIFGHDLVLAHGITGVPLLRSCTLRDMCLSGIDYAIASVHDETFAYGATLAQTTGMYVGALQDPKVLILGHIGRVDVPFELDQVLGCARDLHKLIEINEHSLADHYGAHRHERCREIAVRCAELGVSISLGTDAHIACDVGDFTRVRRLLDEIHFPRELIACSSAETFIGWVDGLTDRS